VGTLSIHNLHRYTMALGSHISYHLQPLELYFENDFDFWLSLKIKFILIFTLKLRLIDALYFCSK